MSGVEVGSGGATRTREPEQCVWTGCCKELGVHEVSQETSDGQSLTFAHWVYAFECWR